MKEYLRSLQWPESMVNTTDYDFFVEVSETGMKAWERIGGVEVTFDGKFGIETGWKLPFPGTVATIIFIVYKAGPQRVG